MQTLHWRMRNWDGNHNILWMKQCNQPGFGSRKLEADSITAEENPGKNASVLEKNVFVRKDCFVFYYEQTKMEWKP